MKFMLQFVFVPFLKYDIEKYSQEILATYIRNSVKQYSAQSILI